MKNPHLTSVLFISGIGGDTRRYRCYHLQEQLSLVNVDALVTESDDPRLPALLQHHDIVILHRVPATPLIRMLTKLAHAEGKVVIFETDDLVFAPEVADHIGYLRNLPPESARRFREALQGTEESFHNSDCLLTTTTFIAEEARRRGKTAYIHRNAPSRQMFRISEAAWESRQRHRKVEGSPLTLGYFSGTASHERDFGEIIPILVWAMERYPRLWLHLSGYIDLDPRLKPFWRRIRRIPFVPWQELPYIIAQTDINLVPLELSNPFCQGKSEIKFLEAALVGVPTIASPIPAYRHVIQPGENGLLARNEKEWREALQYLIEHKEAREQMGEAARHFVYEHYRPAEMGQHLYELLAQVQERHAPPPLASETRYLHLLEGVRQYATSMERQRQEQAEQLSALREIIRQYEARLAEAERYINHLEGKIESILQGRIMRLMTTLHKWREKWIGESSHANLTERGKKRET